MIENPKEIVDEVEILVEGDFKKTLKNFEKENSKKTLHFN